jgi:ArsR family transcriptional regulator, arsenate/arsenite/antimonite-responsive transcriptional repressor
VVPRDTRGVVTSANVEQTSVEPTLGPDDGRATTPAADAVTVFRALGDPTRLRVIELLAGGQRCACEIQAALDVSANLLSHHLKVLREAGLIDGERRGRWIDYRLEPDGVAATAARLHALIGVEAGECGCDGGGSCTC